MSEQFIQDLNEYFSKKYADFDLICTSPSYESVTISMLLQNRNRIEEGEHMTNEMRKIAYQPNAEQVLKEVKERYVDNNFTFSFRIAPVKQRLKALFGSKSVSGKRIAALISRYGEDPSGMAEKLGVSEEIWRNVLKSNYIPEKVLIYRLTLALGMSLDDNLELMEVCGVSYDFADARDVIVRYLVDYRIFNPEMIAATFDEFRIRRLFG